MHMGARGVMTLALPWRRVDVDRLFLAVCLLVPLAALVLFFLYPLAIIALRSIIEPDGGFGLGNYARILGAQTFWRAAGHSLVMRGADARVYEAAEVLGAPAWRQFLDITLPNIKFGLLGAAFVVFTVTITDFGNAATIGGDYSLLATEIYNQVVGQMNFNLGAVVGIMLLLPTVLAFYLERVAAQRQLGVMSEAAVPLAPTFTPRRDIPVGIAAGLVALLPLLVVGVVVYGSFVWLWPYRFDLTLRHYA